MAIPVPHVVDASLAKWAPDGTSCINVLHLSSGACDWAGQGYSASALCLKRMGKDVLGCKACEERSAGLLAVSQAPSINTKRNEKLMCIYIHIYIHVYGM
jgi:hypothetical protein